jgi:hypothetical protein
MSIKEILEKYLHDDDGAYILYPEDFPALERDLSQLLEDRAKEFCEWVRHRYLMNVTNPANWYSIHDVFNDPKARSLYTTSELYALFLTNKSKTDA